jgi:predicted MFS family arabinose efflux permease
MISRVAIGVGEASFVTTAPGFIKDRLNNPAQLNRALGVFFAAIPVGAALGYMLGGALVGSVGWRPAFFVAGVPGILLAAIIATRAETPQREIVAFDGAENVFEKTMTLCKIPSLRIGVIGYTLNSFALSGVATFIVPYGVFRGFDAGEVGKVFGLILVCAGVLGTSIGGKLGSRAAARDTETLTASFSLIAWLSLAATPFFAFAFFTENTILFYLTCFIGEVLVFAVVAPINALLVSEAPPRMVAFSQGVIVLCLNLFGAFLSPLVIGSVADKLSLGWSMQIAVLAVAASGIAWWFGINLKKSRVV